MYLIISRLLFLFFSFISLLFFSSRFFSQTFHPLRKQQVTSNFVVSLCPLAATTMKRRDICRPRWNVSTPIFLQGRPRATAIGHVLGGFVLFNTLNAELNPICHLLALLVHHFLHVSSIRVKSLTLRLLMSYI